MLSLDAKVENLTFQGWRGPAQASVLSISVSYIGALIQMIFLGGLFPTYYIYTIPSADKKYVNTQKLSPAPCLICD